MRIGIKSASNWHPDHRATEAIPYITAANDNLRPKDIAAVEAARRSRLGEIV
jgi:hypothetical protein